MQSESRVKKAEHNNKRRKSFKLKSPTRRSGPFGGENYDIRESSPHKIQVPLKIIKTRRIQLQRYVKAKAQPEQKTKVTSPTLSQPLFDAKKTHRAQEQESTA